MTWVRLADDFYDHPKVIAAGPLAALLWVCGLAYSNRYLTDGYLPAGAVRRLTDLDDPYRLAAKLVDVGLFEATDGGYRIHDYGEYQPSADTVRGQREKTAERVARWRDRHGNDVTAPSGNGVANGQPNAAPGPTPDPDLNPVPAVSTSPQPPPPAEGERLTPVTEADVKLWCRAAERLRSDMKPGNWDQLIAPLVPLGRDPDGGLWLRAPPGQSIATRAKTVVRRALADAGDPHAAMTTIVEQ